MHVDKGGNKKHIISLLRLTKRAGSAYHKTKQLNSSKTLNAEI